MEYTRDFLLSQLNRFFHYHDFREGQAEIVSTILKQQDVLAVLPTGAGKSICFQLPALILPGLTLVVSPLISLMKDQTQGLNKLEEEWALSIDSTMAFNMQGRVLQRALSGGIKLLYVSPERLQNEAFQEFSRQANISLVVVDEAHCVVQWGRYFRRDYFAIPEYIALLNKRPVIAAFTATATREVREEIGLRLDLHRPAVFVAGFDRPNLHFSVVKSGNKEISILRYLQKHRGEKGIIYCTTRPQVLKLQKVLAANGFASRRYHGGLTPLERQNNQNDFLENRVDIMVATNAFGMGIDKKDVRFILHYSMPLDVEGYYQEAGRAGRDGLPGECVLFYNPLDVKICENLLLASAGANIEREKELLRKMIAYCHLQNGYREFILDYFS
ncbi:MAG: RecQ family ATP-dependent DNA helicase [Acidaminococcaceae bacterium]|nr:RecQ family ATP-dependent DNA helicase [Acidaminococcaceae bacterium]